MKNKQLLIIALLVLFSFSAARSQNSGAFMGRRVLFTFSTSLSPAWKKANFFDNSKHWGKYYAFNYCLSPEIEVIAWKKGTAGVVYHHFKTKVEYNYFVNIGPVTTTTTDGIATMTTTTPDYLSEETEVNKLRVNGFGIFYKQYVGGKSRAPLGSYCKLQFDGFFYASQMYVPVEYSVKGKLFATKFEFGHDFLFFDRLKISTAFSFGLAYYRWFTDMPFVIYDGTVTLPDENMIRDIQQSIHDRIFSHYYLGFIMSVGLLSF
ncbi:MAG: hypothetical protein LBQ64_06920 [Bacteroidales bacterium]|jgi:hypothetical protein|nr:hypothetical protein [Bacteroidales bacterium]